MTASGNYIEQGHSFYRLKVRTRGTPVVITDVEPDFLQPDAFTLGEVSIDGTTQLVYVTHGSGCAKHSAGCDSPRSTLPRPVTRGRSPPA